MRTAKDIVRDYAYLLGQPFSCKKVMRDLGLPKRTATRAISNLLKAGEIVLISSKYEGIYRVMTPGQKKDAERERLKAVAEDMRVNGDEYHKILSEVL